MGQKEKPAIYTGKSDEKHCKYSTNYLIIKLKPTLFRKGGRA